MQIAIANISANRLGATQRQAHHRRLAFTLVELLVVIAIIGMLIATLFPALMGLRETARRVQCTNNLAQIGIALQDYESAHGSLPPGTVEKRGPIHNVAQGHHMGWLVAILPYLGEAATYKQVNLAQSVYDKRNAPVRAVSLRVLICPSRGNFLYGPVGRGHNDDEPSQEVAFTTYAGCQNDVEAPIDADNHGVLFLNSHISQRDVTDGTSNTIYVGEKLPGDDDLGWMSGTRATLRNTGTELNAEASARKAEAALTADTDAHARPASDLFVGGFSSFHPTGCNFLFGDGAVHLLSVNLDLGVLQQLAHRADGKLLTEGPTRKE